MAYKDQDKQRASRRKWYYANKEKQLAYKKQRERETYAWVQSLKAKCLWCPEAHPAALEFHHLDPDTKDLPLASVIKQGWSRERIAKEADKCIVLCSNCHRKYHHYLKYEREENLREQGYTGPIKTPTHMSVV